MDPKIGLSRRHLLVGKRTILAYSKGQLVSNCLFGVDLGLMLQIFVNLTFENRTIVGNGHYLVLFGNCTIAGITLIETALTRDPLYLKMQ